MSAFARLSVLAIILGLCGCRSSSGARTAQAFDAAPESAPPLVPMVDVGSPSSQEPISSVITDESPMQGDIFEDHGSEFWLFDQSAQNTGHMTFNTIYGPYQSTPANPMYNGKEVPHSARRCMRQASDTLKAILATPPAEWTAFKSKYSERWIAFFGWINDYRSLTENTPANVARVKSGPFNWQSNGMYPGSDHYKVGGYIKWRGAIYPDGTCKTPSLGQFLQLLKVMDNCESNPGASCTQI